MAGKKESWREACHQESSFEGDSRSHHDTEIPKRESWPTVIQDEAAGMDRDQGSSLGSFEGPGNGTPGSCDSSRRSGSRFALAEDA
jgi:hypothetical protein